MAKLTQKEAVARILASNIGHWFKSHELVQKDVEGKFTGIAPMERAYELVKEGFTSEKFQYTFEHRRVEKFAEFRCITRAPKVDPVKAMNDYWNALPA